MRLKSVAKKRTKTIGVLYYGLAWLWLVALTACKQSQPVLTHEMQEQPGTLPENRFAFTINHPVADCDGREDLSAQDLIVETNDPAIKIQVDGAKLAECPRPAQSRAEMSIALAMDHSWSLYDRIPSLGGYTRYNNATDPIYQKEPGTDPDGMRLEAARNFLTKLPPNTRVLLAYFAAENEDYQILSTFHEGIERAKTALDQLPANPSPRGTPLWNTLMGLLSELEMESPSRLRYIVCFTDGDNMLMPGLPTYESTDVIAKAARSKIPVFFVLLGNSETLPHFEEVKRKVENVAQATGGQSIPVSEASGLQQAFEQLTHAVNVIPCYRLKCFASRPSPFQAGESITVRVRAKTGGEERTYTVSPP